jgi:predicted HTH transcriptional regulator
VINDAEFEALLSRMENETLDFKATAYNLSDESMKADLIKDVLCMVNTPREGPSFIVLGVKKYPDGRTELRGLDIHIDDANLPSQFSDRVQPHPKFHYDLVEHSNKTFGVISIPLDQPGACFPIVEYGGVLKKGQLYFRRGSKNDLAMPHDSHINSIVVRAARGETPARLR